MTAPIMRKFIDIVESKKKSPPGVRVVQYSFPPEHQRHGVVVNHTMISPSSDEEFRRKLRNWMEDIGLDPDDEDDYALINWGHPSQWPDLQ